MKLMKACDQVGRLTGIHLRGLNSSSRLYHTSLTHILRTVCISGAYRFYIFWQPADEWGCTLNVQSVPAAKLLHCNGASLDDYTRTVMMIS